MAQPHPQPPKSDIMIGIKSGIKYLNIKNLVSGIKYLGGQNRLKKVVLAHENLNRIWHRAKVGKMARRFEVRGDPPLPPPPTFAPTWLSARERAYGIVLGCTLPAIANKHLWPFKETSYASCKKWLGYRDLSVCRGENSQRNERNGKTKVVVTF